MANLEIDGLRELGLLDENGHVTAEGAHVVALLVPRFLPMQHGEAFVPLKQVGVHESVELIVVERGKVLLAYRRSIHFHGWHVPGTQRQQRETFQQNASRCAEAELGTNVEIIEILYADHIDHITSPPFHQAAIPLLCRMRHPPTKRFVTNEEPQSGDLKWFSQCPSDMIPDQVKYWRFISRFLNP